MEWWWLVVGLLIAMVAYRLAFWRSWLQANDALWFNTDPFLADMNVHVVLEFKGRVTVESLRAALERGFIVHERFRQLPTRSWLWPYWRADRHFSLDNHVRCVETHLDHAQLEEAVSAACGERYTGDRSPWDFRLFARVGPHADSVLLFRFNHCLGDGLGMWQVALNMMRPLSPGSVSFDDQELQRYVQRVEPGKGDVHQSHPSHRSHKDHHRPSRQPFEKRFQSPLVFLKTVVSMAFHANDDEWTLHTHRPFAKPLVARWAEHPIAVARVKRIAKAAHEQCTVNDVLLAAFYGALRGILQAKSAPRKDEARLRRTACMWVAMRPPASGVTINWGNSLGALYVPLLLEEADPVSRLRAVHESNLRAKASAEALVSHFLFKLFGLLPAAIILPIWRPMAYKASLSFSNVKGPTEPLEFAGCPIARVSFVSLAHHTIGAFVTVMSYNEGVTVGITACPKLLSGDEAGQLAPRFRAEIEALEAALGLA